MKLKKISTLLILLFFCYPVIARIGRIVITKTESYLGGESFGIAGPYVRITGQAYGEVDPDDSLNSIIQDIQLAPRNRKGNVDYISDFIILRPADIKKSNGLLFMSLPNRGNPLPPDTVLLGRGYIYVWCAWQGDVLSGGNRLTMRVPYAGINGEEITGIVRAEFQVSSSVNTLPLSAGFFTGQTHHVYESVSTGNAGLLLTKRIHESDRRNAVPNNEWAFSDCSIARFPGYPDATKISLKDGFEPNYIYELVYQAKNPLVLGLGFAAIRDFSSFLRNELKDDIGVPNPAAGQGATENPVKAAIMQGVSQCSNFARTFLFLGFNRDAQGRKVFDGVNTHAGTRRISLNIRFGRPGGGGLQHEDHLFPGNDPPYTWGMGTDPISLITGSILERCVSTGTCPKIMETLSSTEYWQLRASLTTTDSFGTKDLEIPGNVRIYHFSGTQHTPVRTGDQMSGFPQNDNSYAPYLRALVVAFEKWVLEGKEPPQSRYPAIASNTLGPADKEAMGWPEIPGIPFNGKVNELPFLDYGPRYSSENVSGIIDKEPPEVKSDRTYKTLVPLVDKDGNEKGGIRGINSRVPLGTYTGWALRREGYGKGDLSGLSGMFIPFKNTRKERIEAGDPRPSLKERYGSREKYIQAVRKAAEELIGEGFLLPEDAVIEIRKAEESDVLKYVK